MILIKKLKKILQRDPNLILKETASGLAVEATSVTGFPVSIDYANEEYTVSFGGWHEHLISEEQAAKCVLFAYTEGCRLKIHKKGNFEYKWTMEYKRDEAWEEDSTTGLIFYPFWMPTTIIYRQNSALIPELSELF